METENEGVLGALGAPLPVRLEQHGGVMLNSSKVAKFARNLVAAEVF